MFCVFVCEILAIKFREEPRLGAFDPRVRRGWGK
jgi:hypothetical protein